MTDFVLKNFRFALAILALACIVDIAYSISHASELRQALGPFVGRGIYSSGLLLAITILGWIIYYRDEEGAWLAFVVGTALFVSAVALVISSYINDFSFSKPLFFLLLYLGWSHLGYAFLSGGEILEELGKDPRS